MIHAGSPAPDDAIVYGTVLEHDNSGRVMVICRDGERGFISIVLEEGKVGISAGMVYYWMNVTWEVVE